MIWTNVKATGPTAVIEPLQERNRHKIIAVPKLDRSDQDVDKRKREQKK